MIRRPPTARVTIMVSDDLELSISQYADGTLPADERPAVARAVATDPAAAAALAEYRRLGELLAAPPAGIDWDRLAAHLSSAVGGDDHLSVAGRIGFASWPLRWGAIAAAAVVAAGVGLLMHRSPAVPSPGPTRSTEAVAEVSGPSLDAAAAPGVAEVKVGPSPALAAHDASWRYGEGVVSRPPTVVIAAGDRPPPDRGTPLP